MAAAKRGRRVTLSRGIILDAAFRVVDGAAMNDLTMSRLGRELDADPSAVYRHFRNKDELLLAMADVMLEESMGLSPTGGDPAANLREMCWTMRRSYLSRPGLARYVYFRFTGGEAEAMGVRTMITNMEAMGFDETRSIALVRALAEMTLSHIALTCDSLALPEDVQARELELARSYYVRELQRPPKRTTAELLAAQLEDCDLMFDSMLEVFLAGLQAMAPSANRPARKAAAPKPRTAAQRTTSKAGARS